MQKHNSQKFLSKVKRFFFPVKENKGVTLFLIIYFFTEAFFGVLFVFFVKHLMEALEDQRQDIFYDILYTYAGIFLGAFILLMFLYKGWTLSYNRYRKSIESVFFPKYITFDINAHEKIGTGKSIAILSKGIKMWGGLLDNVIVQMVNLLLSITLTLYLLLQVHSGLALFLLILLIIGQTIGILLNIKVSNIRKKRIKLDNIWSGNVVRIIMAKMEVLQAKKIDEEIQKLHDLHEGQIFYNQKMAIYLVPFFGLGSLLVTILLFVIFIYFGNLYFTGEVTLGLIAATTGAILMMQKEFISTLDFLKNFGKDFAEIQNLWDFFDNTPQMTGYHTGKRFKYDSGKIELNKISYGYDENKKVFKNLSLDIQGSKITAFVGPSGGGKSTLVKLIAGYIRQDSGQILIDNQNLKKISLKSYYEDIGYLTQEPSVFDGSIRENLLYAVKKAPTDTKLKEIIKSAHCGFIYNLIDGIDTQIGERGVRLSGGQKQRLAIAKIFLKDPKIIILDEPTSALDSISEKKITEAMHNLFKKRTVLIIAHRLQTVKHADDIIVIEDGKIIERGTHNSLVKKKGYYKQMLDLQSGF